MQSLDEQTFRSRKLPSRVVMENAGRACATVLLREFPEASNILVLCGGGNNGGDGYVIARALAQIGCAVRVVALKEATSDDTKANALSWQTLGKIEYSPSLENLQSLVSEADIVVDAIFGTGIQGELRPPFKEQVRAINAVPDKLVLAVDVPSGLSSDSGELPELWLEADVTVALQHLKFSHVFFPASDACGRVFCADIGILGSGIRSLLTLEDIQPTLQRHFGLRRETHKGQKGHVAIFGGSEGMFGAPKLSGLATLRSGAGLATLFFPEEEAKRVAPELLELMCQSRPRGSEELRRALSSVQAAVLGPGLGEDASSFVKLFLENVAGLPCVVDADALNTIAKNQEWMSLLGSQMVLTPHPGEMARLLGLTTAEVQSQRLECARKLVEKTSSWVVLKGARSVICGPKGECFVNPAASDLLATAGSGDVLSGVIAAFLARGVPIEEAVCAGVYLHGLSAECFSDRASILASDIVDGVARLITKTRGRSRQAPQFVSQIFPCPEARALTNEF